MRRLELVEVAADEKVAWLVCVELEMYTHFHSPPGHLVHEPPIIFVKAGGENGFMCTVYDLSLSAEPLEGEKEIFQENDTKEDLLFEYLERHGVLVNNVKIFIYFLVNFYIMRRKVNLVS